MTMQCLKISWWAAAAMAVACLAPAHALPGDATSLRETHGDWSVTCIKQKTDTLCAMSQVQADPKTRKRVLSIELQLTGGKSAKGVLIMPFGLALKQGVSLGIDEKQGGKSLPYSTCLPVGCVVPLSPDNAFLEALKVGSKLTIKAAASADNQPLAFEVSLKGFSAAYTRLVELQK